eukprot:scaffold462_cov195-Pinguiococcus_pyrenoidosus.AAC.1
MVFSSHTLTVLCCILHSLALLSSSSAAEDFGRILRGNQRDCFRQENGPEASLVQSKAFQKDFFDDTFPPVTFIKDFEYECDITRKDAMAFGRRMLEMQQAVSFTHFFREIYPKTTFKKASELSRTDSLVFWPICGYAQGYMGNVSVEAERDQKGIERGIQILRDPKMKKLLMNATNVVHESRHFWVAEHPVITPATAGRVVANPFSRIRMLAVDVGGGGNFYSIMIPQGTPPELCLPDLPSELERPNLVSFCGHAKAWGGFPSLRPHIAGLLQGIIEGDGEKNIHASLAQPREEYTRLFFQSKFCFVTPGDTSSTSQGVRSMCGGCVPVILLAVRAGAVGNPGRHAQVGGSPEGPD